MKKKDHIHTIADIRDLQDLGIGHDLEFLAREVVEGFITGLHRSPFHGFSVEFAEHRLYNQGESTRHIDWKLYGRTEKLFVKRYEEETNLRCQIVIDVSSSMRYPADQPLMNSKLGFSIFSAAALITLLRRQRDAVGLSLFSDELDLNTPARLSTVHAKLLFHELNRILTGERNLENRKTMGSVLLHQVADSLHQRSLVIIFSDMMESENEAELFGALQHLRHNKHEVVLFHVNDKQHEHLFDFKNRPYRFIDLESGEEVKLNPNEIRSSYVDQMSRYFASLKEKCGQFRIDLVEADVAGDFSKILLPYLIKRGKLN